MRMVGALYVCAGIATCALATCLPSSDFVRSWQAVVAPALASTTAQVRFVRDSLDELDTDEAARAAAAVAAAIEQAAALADRVNIDFEAADRAAEALDAIATALESLDVQLEGARLVDVATELETVASTLDEEVAPAAEAAAKRIAAAAKEVEERTQTFADALAAADLNADVVVSVSDALEGFSTAVGESGGFVGTVQEELPAAADALKGLAVDLRIYEQGTLVWWLGDEAKRQVASVATECDRFSKILEELGVTVLPNVEKALTQARDFIRQISEGAKRMRDRKEDIDALMKDGPRLLATTGKEVGRFGRLVSEVLAETGHINKVAALLRASAKQLRQADAALPAAGKAIAACAVAVRGTQRRMAQVSRNSEAIADIGPSTGRALSAAAEAIEELNTGVASKLDRQKAILEQAEAGCADLQSFLPRIGTTASRMLTAAKVCAALLGLAFIAQGWRTLAPTRLTATAEGGD